MSNPQAFLYCDSASSMPTLPEVWSFLKNDRTATPPSWGCNLSSDHGIATVFQNQYESLTSQLFSSLKCTPSEWFWTSGATEANEWAIQIALASRPDLKTIFVHPLSHPSLSLSAARLAKRHDLLLEQIPLQEKSYQIDFHTLGKSHEKLQECLIVLPYGDNELGAIEINLSSLKAFGWVHFDAAQSFAKIPLDLSTLPCASLACSGYKFGALPGLGGLYVRLRPKKTIEPLFVGGSQQNGLRAGTLPFLLIQTFAIAYQAWQAQEYAQKLALVRTQLLRFLKESLNVQVLSPSEGLPHILTFEVPYSKKDAVIRLKNTIAFSQGSACQKGQGSPALSAIGISLERQKCMLRLGLSPYNVKDGAEIQERLLEILSPSL